MIDVVKQLGCVRHNGVVMTAEERAAGYDHFAASAATSRTRGSLAASMESLRAELATYGVEPSEGSSLRLAVHRARAELPEGVQAALQRSDAREARLKAAKAPARYASLATVTKAATSKPEDRVKVVAHALETDPALKGKAEAALCFLADPAFAGVTGQGVIKLLKAGATTEPPKLATTTTKPTTTRKRSDALGGGNAPTAESKASWDRVYDRMFGAKA